MGLLKRIADRRAAKGGPIVTWWRRMFGTGAADALEDWAVKRARLMLADVYKMRRGELTSTEFRDRWPQEYDAAQRTDMERWAKDYVAAVEGGASLKRVK